jgi:hypothetical protein
MLFHRAMQKEDALLEYDTLLGRRNSSGQVAGQFVDLRAQVTQPIFR